jgi:hypothetical protein
MDRMLALAALLPDASAQSSTSVNHLWSGNMDPKMLAARVDQHLTRQLILFDF